MSGSVNAPDGIRWPMPIVAVSKEEQRPWLMGWYPYADRLTDRAIVASDRPDPCSPILKRYGAPFSLQSHDLKTADYQLVGPDGPLDGFVGIERKERDLASSLTAEMSRFKEECDRLRCFTNPLIVTSCTLEDLVSSHPQHEPAFVGGIAVIAARYRIPLIPCASRTMAERFAARFLVEVWQSYLAVNPVALAWAREDERRRGIVREHRRAQKKATTPASFAAGAIPANALAAALCSPLGPGESHLAVSGLLPAGGARASSTEEERRARAESR